MQEDALSEGDGGLAATGADRQVLVVDDQRALADAIRIAIDLADGLTCVGVAGDVEHALRLCAAAAVDVVLMDIELPGVDGIEGTRRMKKAFPNIDVYVFTGFGDVDSLAAVAASGASGFFTKSDHLDNVLEALRHPVDRQMVVDPGALATILAEARSDVVDRQEPVPPPLTAREGEVLEMLGAGLGPQGIALQLGVSVHTVRGHVKSILAKLGVHSQLEAVALAVASGWIGRDRRPGGDGTGNRLGDAETARTGPA